MEVHSFPLSTLNGMISLPRREIFAATLSVVSPGQEEALWESLRREPMLENEGTVAKKRKYFDVKSDLIDALIEAHNQVQSW